MKNNIFAFISLILLSPFFSLHAFAESHIIEPTTHPDQMGIHVNQQRLCYEDVGTKRTLAPSKEGDYEDYAWFKYENGEWTQLTNSATTITVTMPTDVNAAVWYYFTSVRLLIRV